MTPDEPALTLKAQTSAASPDKPSFRNL